MKRLFILLASLLFFITVDAQIPRFPFHRTSAAADEGGGNDFLTSLVAYWELDEASGTFADSQGSNTMTENNGVTYGVTGMGLGDAVGFVRASEEYLNCPEDASLEWADESFSFIAWIYLTTLPSPGEHYYIIGGDNGSPGIEIYNDGATTTPRVSMLGNDVAAKPSLTVTAESWIFIGGTFDTTLETNSTVYYVNSSSETENFTYAWSTATFSNHTTAIGARLTQAGAASLWFNGTIGQVGIWKGRILSPANMAAIYNSGSGLAFTSFE